MPMTGTFGRKHNGQFNWRREVPPVLAVAALAADYLSPPALWTMILPFAGVILLIALRRWALAATVFLLCSWVLIPTAARAAFAIEEINGEHPAYVIDGIPLQSLQIPVADPCGLDAASPRQVGFTALPVGPGHLINPRWILRDTIVSFAELHNVMVIERWFDETAASCGAGALDDAR